MKQLRAIGEFVYGLVIGDDWKLTAGVVVSLLVARLLLALSVPTDVVAVATASMVAATFCLSLLIDARRTRPSSEAAPRS